MNAYERCTDLPGVVTTDGTDGRNRIGSPLEEIPIKLTVMSRDSMGPVVLDIAGGAPPLHTGLPRPAQAEPLAKELEERHVRVGEGEHQEHENAYGRPEEGIARPLHRVPPIESGFARSRRR